MDEDRPAGAAAAIAARAAADAGMAAHDLLAGYVEMLLAVVASGRRLADEELDTRRALGARAAEQNVAERSLIDMYLDATWLTWRALPADREATSDTVTAAAESVMRAAYDAIGALLEGYEGAHSVVVREDDTRRREFVNDLLAGRSDMGRAAELAERLGLRLAGQLAVATARTSDGILDTDTVTRRVESALLNRFGARDVVVTPKEGLLTCIALANQSEVLDEFSRLVADAVGTGEQWCVGIGRPHAGPIGVLRSYEEARGTVELAASLGLWGRVLHTADLLVFQVLLRDRVAMISLVATVLGPLAQARGGAKPLLDTLAAYFAAGGVTAAASRRLYLSVRAVTYRLNRIKQLTGKDVNDPTERFTLEAAVLGARLLDWPNRPLPPTD